MTVEDDFDRISRAWLDLMPDEAPDRAVDAVLRAVATTPQVRRWRPASWRPNPMNKLAYAVVAAALVVAVGGALLLIRPGSNDGSTIGTTPSASPSPTTSSSPSAGGSVPAELQARWMGGTNDLVGDDTGSTFLLDGEFIELGPANDNGSLKLTSQASTTDAGLLHFAGSGRGECDGDGDYDWTLSPSGRVLTLSVIADACTQRGTALTGSWWKMGCTADGDNCLGPLDAGTYKSQFIAPHVDPGATWAPAFGALTYTVPDGWANASDWPESFELVPASELPPIDDADRIGVIDLFTQPTAMSQDRPCSDKVEPGVGRTADELATWIATVPGLVTSEPTPITINGRSGQTLDISIDPSWTGICNESDPDKTPIVTYLNPGLAVRGDERTRLILLDLGDGDVLAIGTWTRDQAAFDSFIPEAMPVIESFQFE
jgi:hypothetical protein